MILLMFKFSITEIYRPLRDIGSIISFSQKSTPIVTESSLNAVSPETILFKEVVISF